MKTVKLLSLFISLFAFVSFAQEVKFNPTKSEIKWTGKKVSGEHFGNINLKEGSITLKGNAIVAGKFVIDMTSITVKDLEPGEWHDKLLGHLKSDDFFGVEKYPEAVLVIDKSTPLMNKMVTITGKLTIKGKTQPVVFVATKTDMGYTAKVMVDRTKYDIRYGSGKFFENLGDKMIYDDFTLEVTLVK